MPLPDVDCALFACDNGGSGCPLTLLKKSPLNNPVMPGGKAHGKPREYQVFARNVLQILRLQEKLEPYAGDGIDVEIKLGYATFNFDVALKGSDNRIVVGESVRALLHE